MNRETLYDQVVKIYEDSGKETNLEQSWLLLTMGDLLNKSKDKNMHYLPMPYYEEKAKSLDKIIEGITPTEIKNLHGRFLFVQKSFEYRDSPDPEKVLPATKELPWWMKRDALRHGISDHFKIGTEGAGYGVQEVLHRKH